MDEQRAWIKSRRKKRLRILAAALAFCLLFTTYPDILETLSVLAAETQDGDNTVHVQGFEDLPEEVREQTVPLGTAIEELTLPDTLEAFVMITEEEDASEEDAPDKKEDPDDSGTKEENTVSGAGIGSEDTGTETGGSLDGMGTETETGGEAGGAGTETETGGEADGMGTETETGGEAGGAETDDGNGGSETDTETGDGAGGVETNTETTGDNSGAETDTETDGQTGNGDADGMGTDAQPETDKKDVPAAVQEQAAPETIEKESINQESVGTGESASRKEERETYTVTLPVYAAGNELAIETLENPAKQTETANPPEQTETTNQTEQTETANPTEQTETTNSSEQPETTEQTEAVTIEGVTWESVPEYDGSIEGVYLFTAVLPEGYVLSEGVSLPEIMVTVAKDSAQAEELHALLELLRALPDPEKYISYDEAADKVTKNKEMIDDEQLRSAREATDKYLEAYPDTAADIDTQNASLDALLARLEGLEHIRDTSGDCSDLGCPYHYPQFVCERMTETETPELLTLEDLTEDYGVEEPAAPVTRTLMKAYGARAAAPAPHPQTLMETYDNENNAHTGASDNDLDKLLTGDLHSNLPIEVSFTLNELPTQSAYLAIKAYDVDEEGMEWDYVYINDDIYKPMDKSATGTADRNHPHENEKCTLTWNDSNIGRLAGTDEMWNVTVLEIPLEKLVKGKNVISITVAQDWNLEVDWMQLVLDGGAKDADLSGFSLQLNKSVKDNNTVKVYTDAILTQSGTKEYAAEYTLTEESTGNAVDVCIGSISDKKTIEHNMPLDSPTGTYTITGILKDENENIKAIESVKFFFIKDVGMGMKITHTLSPGLLTNKNVTINVNAEPVSSAITDVTVTPKTTGTATTNGTYEFTVEYKVDGTHCTSSYSVKVDNIDKTPPQLTYEKLTVLEDTPQSEVNELFQASLSATDDRKLAEPPFTYTIPSDISNSGGTKTVSVTVTDVAGNKTTKNCEINVTAKPLELTIRDAQAVAGSKDSFNLNAVLTRTGTDPITEMGFVWGVMPNPTLELNNGTVKLVTVVTAKGGALSAKATKLVTGVQYNARAYAKVTKAGQTSVVYSDAKSFGFDVPDHGKISVSGVKDVSGGCEFTISRTGGTEGAQTVYYRTVNGSAIGDTHFGHANGSVTFNDGEDGGKTVTITEHSVTAVYGGNPATAYSNESRTYSLEIYRVDGGGEINKNSRSQIRTMSKDSSYTIDKSVYTEQSKEEVAETTGENGEPVYPSSGGHDLSFMQTQDGKTNYNTKSELSDYYSGNQGEYLENTMDGWYYRYELKAYFSAPPMSTPGQYGHAYIGKSALTDTIYSAPVVGIAKWDLSAPAEISSGWTCSFTHDLKTQYAYSFPDTATESENNGKPYKTAGSSITEYGGKKYVGLETGDTCHVHFGKRKSGSVLYVNGLKSYALGYDNTEPKCIGVAPMAGGTYFAGDPITVALVFNEIVDKDNSPNLGAVKIETNVGILDYAGGVNTNVLYFTGNVSSDVNLNGTGALQVISIVNSGNIFDMCSLDIGTATAAPSYSGNTNVIVDATKPSVTITPNTSGSLPSHQAKVTATNAASVQYAWTKSTDTPAGGWQTTTSQATLTESRGAAGSTETWYLHVLATASTGASTHECQAFTFMQPAITSVSVRASDNGSSSDVSNTWKTFKYIEVQYAGAQVSTAQKPTTLTVSLNGEQKASWSLDAASGTKYLKATENGSYTVTLKDSYGNVLSKVVEVKKIDNTAPTLTLRSGSSTDSAVIHNSVTVAVFPEDNAGGSGLAKVEYAWTDSSNAPIASDWKTLTTANGSYQTTYTATEATKTQKYLHVRVTDVAGNTTMAQSGPYSVVKEAEPAQLPTISVTTSENGTWTKSAILTWQAKANGSGNSIVRVFVPDKDRAVTATSGTCTVTKNGVYMFSATDSNSNTVSEKVVVQHIDNDAPKLDAITAGLAADAESGTITLTGVTDNCTNVLNENGKVLSVSGSGINSIEYRHESDPETEWKSLTNAPTISFDVEKNGTYTVRLTDKLDNSRDYTVVMEGIDKTAPEVTCTIDATANAASGWYTGAEVPVKLTFADNAGSEGGMSSGIKSVEYKLVSDNADKPADGLTGLRGTDLESGSYTHTITGNGQYYLYYKVTDNKGNVTDGFSGLIKKDSCESAPVLTGPAEGAATLTMNISLTYGPGGGVLYDVSDGSETQLAEMPGDNGMNVEDKTKEITYEVNSSGTYALGYKSTASGETSNVGFSVCEVTFDRHDGTGSDADGSADSTIPAQLVWHDGTEAVKCKVDKPADPVRTGYTFGGWYTDEDCTADNKFDFGTQVKTDTVLYAKWTVNSYNVTYNLMKPDNSAYEPAESAKKYTYGVGLTLPVPDEVEGYTFYGWYGDEQYTGEAFAQIGETATGDKEYYGYYKDIAVPAITAALTKEKTGDDPVWYNAADVADNLKIQLTYSDNKGVSDVLVKVDDGNYTSVTDVTTGDATQNETTAYYELQEGVHTYTFKAVDEAGNVTETDKLTVKLDKTKPEFSELSYENKAKDFLDWIIGKESLIITVPVTDNGSNGKTGSGVSVISYTLTPADGSTGATETTGTAEVKDGKAKITVSADFKGTVKISCSDAAGNAADDKTIGTSGGTGGVIVEDNAPAISALADRSPADMAPTVETALSESYYATCPEIKVTVKDDIDNAVTAGIASVTCLIGETDYPVTVGTDALKGEITFTIPADKIPTGSTTIEIKTVDNAGNTASFTFALKVNGAEKKPTAKIDYQTEKLTGLEPDAPYSITYTDGNGAEQTVDVTTPDGTIPLNEEWIGDTIKIVRKGNGSETSDSEEQELTVPGRPSAPASAPELDKRTDTSVTLKRIDGVQYCVNGGDWQDSPEFTGLDPETEYTFEVRYPAKDDAFASLPADSTKIITMPKAPAEDSLSIDYEKETFTLKGGVEAFTDKECTQKVNLEDGTGNAADYMGQPLYIRYPEKDGVPAGMTTKVQIPERPETPNVGKNDASYPGALDGSVTGLDDSLIYEIREKGADGNFGEWKGARLDGTEIKNLPAGEYEVRVKAEKTFRSETVSVTIGEKPTTPYDKPTAVQIDYAEEKLDGFELNEPYTIKYTDNGGTEQTIDVKTPDGTVPLKEEWLGKTLSVVHKGNGKDKTDSAAQEFTVPQRPEKPSPTWKDETGLNKKDGKLMGLTPGTVYDISKDDGKTWTEQTADAAGEIKGVDAPATYVVRVAATNSGFRGPVCGPVAVDGYHIPVTFMANGETAGTSWAYYGKAPEKIPAVPKKEDTGDKIFVGEWCADENGTPADLTNVTAVTTFYAYYTVGYNIILRGGTGYTLSAASGSASPVKEGGSFTFKFTLNSGYEKTGSFAVKVNGVKAGLAADGTYTITDVRENQTVTVEGIVAVKNPSDASGGGNGGSGDDPGDKTEGGGNSSTGGSPSSGDTPPTDANPAADKKPDDTASGKTKPNGTTPGSTASGKTKPNGTTPGSTASGKTKSDSTTSGGTASDKAKPDGAGLTTVTVSAAIENGRIVIPEGTGIPQTGAGEDGATAATGTARIMTDGMNGITTVSMVLQIGGDGGGNADSAGGSNNAAGAVIVTVVCEEQAYTAGVADTVAVANAVLTPEQIQLVGGGETIEIRVDVKDISETVPGQDKEIIENGLAECRKKLPDLTLGMYVDISMFIKVGEGGWNAVTSTKEPVDVVIGIPETLKAEGREFTIIRSHDGTYTLLPDLDDNPDTITISTDLFSAYAIAYEQADQTDGNGKCGLCHICPTFFGICYFIWLAVILAVLLIIGAAIWRNRKKREEQEGV